MEHQDFLQKAVDLATENVSSGGGPYGAIIVKNGQIIAGSGNRVTCNLDPTAHAEIMAIRLACQALQDFKLTDCILYTSCEPCPMCLGAIYWSHLQQVFFACNRHDAAAADFDDSFIYDEIALPLVDRRIPMQQIHLADALQPFNAWAADQYKISY